MTRLVSLATVALLLAAPATALAQSGRGGGNTGGGIPPASGGAGSRAGSTTAAGQTKPPGDAVGDRLGTRPDLDRKSQLLDRQIKNGICRGC